MAALLGLLVIIFAVGLSYLIVAGLTYLICLGFGLAWSWLLALGAWALILLLRSIFKSSN